MAVIVLRCVENPAWAAQPPAPVTTPKPPAPAPATKPTAPVAPTPSAPAPVSAPASQPPATGTAPKPPAPAPTPPAVSPAQKEEPKQAPYAYAPRGRRDPFTPLIIKEEKKAPSAAKSPLQRYNISDFKFTGVVWGGLGFNAILEAPDGKGYFIRVGSVVGPNGGVVKRITQNSLLIEEKYKTFGGETQRKEIVVELRKRQE